MGIVHSLHSTFFFHQKQARNLICWWSVHSSNKKWLSHGKWVMWDKQQQQQMTAHVEQWTQKLNKHFEGDMWGYFCSKTAVHPTKQTERNSSITQSQRKEKRVYFSCICCWMKKHLLLFWHRNTLIFDSLAWTVCHISTLSLVYVS